MKLVIPVDEKNIDSVVCISFGRTPYFLVYNTETKEISFLDNSAIASSGGAGIKAAQSIVDIEGDILITPRCGENAADVLEAADIKIYKSKEKNAKGNIEDFINGVLLELTDIHEGFHGQGAK